VAEFFGRALSRDAALADCVQRLRLMGEDQLLQAGAFRRADRERQLLTRKMFFSALSDELIAAAGRRYLDYVWADLVYEYDASAQSRELMAALRSREQAGRAVHSTLERPLATIEDLAARLESLEVKAQRATAMLTAAAVQTARDAPHGAATSPSMQPQHSNGLDDSVTPNAGVEIYGLVGRRLSTRG
jgi:hypothetical protein